MMAAHRDQHLADKQAKDARWPNMYGDLNPLPDVKKDMVEGASNRPVNPNVYWEEYAYDINRILKP